MNPYDLSIHIVEDIRSRLRQPNAYNYIKISGLIRQLLFDQNQVLLIAQKHADKPFLFFLGGRGIKYDPQHIPRSPFVFIAGSLDPEKEVIEVKPEEYGSLKVVLTNSHAWSIRDVVRYVANKRGGVHYDERLEPDQKPLDEISRALGIQGTESMFNQVGYIGQNVVNSAIRCGYIGY